ncbi:MAG: PASTA domain-containing protein [Desulfobacterales bacterium]
MTRIIRYILLFILFSAAVSASAYFTLAHFMKSRDTVLVPALEGKEIVYALELLTEIGLNIKVKGSEFSPDIPKNHIIFQDPSAGSEIKKGRDVRIVLSKGTENIPMPNLTGISLAEAHIIMESNGVKLETISYASSAQNDKGVIIAQVPLPGVVTRRSEGVNLLIGTGPRPAAFQMPDLTGIPLDKAVMAMEHLNLSVGDVVTVYREEQGINTVVGQHPKAGSRITTSDPVELTVNRPREASILPPSALFKGPNLYVYKAENGFLNTRIRLRLNIPGISMDLFDDFIEPARDLWVLVPSNRGAGLFLYENEELVAAEIYD